MDPIVFGLFTMVRVGMMLGEPPGSSSSQCHRAVGIGRRLLMMSRRAGADVTNAPVLFAVTAVLSNVVSNVPAVMLLLPAARDAVDGAALALSSTLAGTLIIAGSVANIIWSIRRRISASRSAGGATAGSACQ